jgi:hypothetical protein
MGSGTGNTLICCTAELNLDQNVLHDVDVFTTDTVERGTWNQ